MLLNKHSLSLATLASKETSRYTLNAIAIERDCTLETDGYQLMVIGHPANGIAEDTFPETPGLVHAAPGETPTLLQRDAALAALKALPRKSAIPVLMHAALGEGSVLYVNSLDSVETFKAALPGQFPNWRAVMPTGEPTATVTLNAVRLAALVKWFAEHAAGTDHQVTLAFFDEGRPIRLTAKTDAGQDVTAVLMPSPAAR